MEVSASSSHVLAVAEVKFPVLFAETGFVANWSNAVRHAQISALRFTECTAHISYERIEQVIHGRALACADE